MDEENSTIGFARLAQRYGITPVMPLRVTSKIAGTRKTLDKGGAIDQEFPVAYQPDDTLQGHFEFGLKYEEVHLEFFSRLFEKSGSEPIKAWITAEPTGSYSRRAAFLYEWITGQRIDTADVTNGGYIDAIDSGACVTSTTPIKNRRWRINNNLPGTNQFCPLVRRSGAVVEATGFSIQESISKLEATFGADLLFRSASWLTFKESKSSFLIEKEADKEVRIKRFAHAIAQYCGKIPAPLSNQSLETLQKEILGADALRTGMRKSPIFIGQDTISGTSVHYVAPPWDELEGMLQGLRRFEELTRGQNPTVRAAATAFAFVYIHPMKDGNGRIHRFLVNDILSRDGAVPAGIILPISATITESSKNRADYDRVLDVFSRPFMRTYEDACKFEPAKVAEDGVSYNLNFTAYKDALHAWRFPDLTQHVEYMAKIIQSTILKEMTEEAQLLRKFDTAQSNIKEVVEMPNADAQRIIKSISSNNMQVSNKLVKEYPTLFGPDVTGSKGTRLLNAVRDAFAEEAQSGGD